MDGKKITIKSKSFTNWFLVLFIIFATDSNLVCSNDNRIWARISWLAIIFLFVFYVGKFNYKLNKKFIEEILLCTCIILSMVVHGDVFNVNYYQRALLILVAVYIATSLEYECFIAIFISAMRIIAVMSLVGFVFHSAIEELSFLPEIITGNGKIIFKNLLFANIKNNSIIKRNYGIFWEPGAYQLYLNWALYYTLTKKNKICLFDVVLFSLTIITTKSTAGIMILGMVIISVFFEGNKLLKEKKDYFQYKLIILMVSIAGMVLILNNSHLMSMFFSKITSFVGNKNVINSGNVSAYTRFYSVLANIDIMKDNPLFGIGSRDIKQAVLNSYGITANTNSILAMGALYGIFAGFMYVCMFIKAVKSKRGFISKCIYLIMLIMMYSTENLIVSLFFYLVLIYEGNVVKKGAGHESSRVYNFSRGKIKKAEI